MANVRSAQHDSSALDSRGRHTHLISGIDRVADRFIDALIAAALSDPVFVEHVTPLFEVGARLDIIADDIDTAVAAHVSTIIAYRLFERVTYADGVSSLSQVLLREIASFAHCSGNAVMVSAGMSGDPGPDPGRSN